MNRYLEHFFRITFYVSVASYASNEIIVATPQDPAPNAFFVLGFLWDVVLLFFVLIMMRGEVTMMMQRSKLPDGTLGLPFLGKMIPELRDPMGVVKKECEMYGGMYLTHLFFEPMIRMASDEDVTWLWNCEREGLVKTFAPPHVVKLLGGSAVTTTSGKRHQMLRRILEPAFMPRTTSHYVEIIDRVIESELKRICESASFQPTTAFKPVAMTVFVECVFGSDVLDQKTMQTLSRDFQAWIASFFGIIPFDLPGTTMRQGMNARCRMLNHIETLIEKHKQLHPEKKMDDDKSLMGRLLSGKNDNNEPLSSKELANNILLILAAGYDTTYASIGSILYHLNQHPQVKNALREEVSTTLSEPLDYQELKDAPILNAVMAESWRITPPVAYGGFKEAVNDIHYKGYNIPKGMKFMYSIAYGCHNPAHYQDPEDFHMERFLPPDHFLVKDSKWCTGIDYHAAASKAKFRTFGGGAHGCFGLHFAKLELRVLLVRLLQHFEFELKDSSLQTIPMYCWLSQFRLKERK